MHKGTFRGFGPLLVLALWAGMDRPAKALDLQFPGAAEQTASRTDVAGSVRLPVGPYANDGLPTRLAEGGVSHTAFRVTLSRASTLELMQPLRDQLVAAGHRIEFECETEICGGYDFRYGTEVLPEPDMHVDLGDFRYLLARAPGGGALALLVSRSGLTGFVQVSQVGPVGKVAPIGSTAEAPSSPSAAKVVEPSAEAAPSDLIAGLLAGQTAVLEDLVFPSGSSALAEGRYGSLDGLATWLKADGNRTVVLVGHTDASGSLQGNIKLSRLRAESVRQQLLFSYKVSPDQVQAEGVGYLSPRASNATEAGQRKNRRVEVMMTSTDLLNPG